MAYKKSTSSFHLPSVKLNTVVHCSIFFLVTLLLCSGVESASAGCICSGGGSCYNITDESSFDAVPWLGLTPGDTVRIHYRSTPYQRNIAINDSGTDTDPVTICGVADATNNRPTIQASGTGPDGDPVIDIGGTSNITIEGLGLTNGRKGIISAPWPGSDNIVISNNEIFGNGDNTPVDSNHGGGIDIYGDNILIENNTVRDNFSGRSGGIFVRGANNVIRNNLIQDNIGYHDHGGGLYINASSNTTVTRNIIEGNVTGPYQGGGHGGGILIAESSDIALSYNIVRNNFAYAAGAGMWIDEASTATLDHELVYNNVSNRYGAGIGVDERYTLDPSHAVITNSTIAYNYSTRDQSWGYGSGNGLMCDTGSTAEVRNTIFYGNKRLTGCSDLQEYDLSGCDFSGPADDFRISTQSDSVPVDPGAIVMTYSLSGEAWPGTGNIQEDPLFIDAENGNYHLDNSTAGCSPAIDAGDPASVYANEPQDNGDRINMGVYGNTVEAGNACGCRGSGTCYVVTNETEFDNVPWLDLDAGDTVLIHHKSDPYRRRFGLHAIGTAEQPVRITGVKSPTGELPHLLGENAVTPENMRGFYSYGGPGYPGFRGMVIINGEWGRIPANIVIENLKITGANENNQFYDEDGVQRTYYGGAGGVYVYIVNGLTVRGCEIAENGNGFYTRSTGGEVNTTRNILVEKNYIHSNGNVDGDQRHNIYTESAGITFQYNRIGRERPGARGSSFKDRSSGLVFRYNWIESTARTMDLVEAEDGAPVLIYEPDYDKTYVYGNIIINEVDDNDDYVSASNLIHYGGDNSVNDETGQCTQFINGDPVCRTGTLYFFNNTVIIKDYRDTPAGSNWVQTRIFEISVNDATADIRNNIFHLFAPNGHPNMALMKTWGTANLYSTNWITGGWMEGHHRDWPGTGAAINNYGTLLEGTDPGFASLGAVSGDLSIDDYTPVGSSAVIDRSGPLAADAVNAGHTVSHTYRLHNSFGPREIGGAAMDLGAFESTGPAGEAEDTNPPVRSGSSPGDTLPFGTTSVEMSLTTNESATCRYSATAGTSYGAMTSSFATTNGTFHTTGLTGLQNGASYSCYVRCLDDAGNVNDTDYEIQFAVAADASSTVDTRVAAGTDDAEENSSGGVSLNSSDLELVTDSTTQTVGIRFAAVDIPQDVTITRAYIEFTADEAQTEATSLVIEAEEDDNPATFSSAANNISSRPRTSASVSWDSLAAWTLGQTYQSPDISSIVQELVNRAGWQQNNSMVFIITGSGHRTADSYDGNSAAAPLLHIEYSTGSNTGDVNGDGEITTTDVILALQVAVGHTPSGIALESDADDNGCIGISEAIEALRKVAGIASE